MRVVALSVALLVAACGAKTGLRTEAVTDATAALDAADIPDVPSVTLVPDVPEPFEACVAGTFGLARRSADVLLVLDRSGSMEFDLDGGMTRPRRWDVLRDALAATLPAYEAQLEMGAVIYPRRFDGDFTRTCALTGAVDVAIAPRNARAVVDALAETSPWGATPTHDALRFAGALLAARPSRGRSRTIVLATDGAPNCNATLDPRVCDCTSVSDAGASPCDRRPTVCLDADRTVAAIAQLAAGSVPTYVIGIDDPSQPRLVATLDRMAIAGGRPNPRADGARYYSVRRREELVAAFDTIARTIARCAFVTPSRPDDPDAIDVLVDGARVPRDARRADGWDWTDPVEGEVTFYGPACDRVANRPARVTAEVRCGARRP